MSHWNYRLVRVQSDAGAALILTEVYYDDAGKPNGYIPDGCTFVCEDEEGRESIVDALMMAANAAKSAPILDAAEIGNALFEDEKETGAQ
jgi:hypothetical protein